MARDFADMIVTGFEWRDNPVLSRWPKIITKVLK